MSIEYLEQSLQAKMQALFWYLLNVIVEGPLKRFTLEIVDLRCDCDQTPKLRQYSKLKNTNKSGYTKWGEKSLYFKILNDFPLKGRTTKLKIQRDIRSVV